MSCPELIDDMSASFPRASIGGAWEYVADTVMGGVSSGGITRQTVRGRPANRLTGRVSLDNNGGFVQMALDLAPGGATCDARAYRAVAIDVTGNGEDYNLHLRTADVTRPWQSYRAGFTAGPVWRRIILPFGSLDAHRIAVPFDPAVLRRIGLVAIGRAFEVDLAVGRVALLR